MPIACRSGTQPPLEVRQSSRIDFYCTQMGRLRDKGDPLKDAKKAQFYLGRLIEKLEYAGDDAA